MADVSFNVVVRLQIDTGKVCTDLHDELVQGVTATRIQSDKVWLFTHTKRKNVGNAKAVPADASC